MLEVQRVASRPGFLTSTALLLLTGAVAIGLGVAIGNPTPRGFLLIGGVGAAAVVAFAVSGPFRGFLVLAASAFVLAAVAVTQNRYLNAYDLLLPSMTLMWMFSRQARAARAADALLTGPNHEAIGAATRGFTRAVTLFYGITGLSLIPMIFRFGPQETLTSALVLARSIEGLLIFPLGLWLLRSEDRIRSAYSAILVGIAILAVVNTYQALALHPTPRVGITWVTNHPDWPVEGPNEAATSLVMVFALILAHHATRPRARNYFLFGSVILLLLLTMSRSGILALLTFLAFSLRQIRGRYVVAGLGLLSLMLVVVPYDFWLRMGRTLTFHKGSFEVYTIMIRVFGYITSWRIFLDNWLFGVGYLGGRYISQNYNEMKIANLGAENFFLDTAVSTGMIGLAALTYCFVKLFKLGATVRRVTRSGSFAHELARLHTPMMVSLMVANLTSSAFAGMAPLAQIGVWCVLMVRGGHLAVQMAPSVPVQPGEGRR